MKKIYRVITVTICYLCLVERMVLSDGMEYLDYILQKITDMNITCRTNK